MVDWLLEARNVTLQDYDGNVIAGQAFDIPSLIFSSQVPGFWQYGSVSWSSLSTWLHYLIRTKHPWAIFDLDESSIRRHGAQQPLGSVIVPPGVYILLQQGKHPLVPVAYSHLFLDGSPLKVALTENTARLRQPTHLNSPVRVSPPPPPTFSNNI